MAYDGIQFGNRVDNFTERKLHAKVVDNVLNSPTYFTRLMGMGEPFEGKTYDYTIKITSGNQNEFFVGLENLSTSATDTTITLSYAHTAFDQAVVIPLVDAMANTGPEATINMVAYKKEEAVAEAVQRLAVAGYGTGAGNAFLGLDAIVDDGTTVGSIGGQSRTTYPQLDAYILASGGTLTLAKMAQVWDNIIAAGLATEEPDIMVTTKAIWTLYEQLLIPAVRAEYSTVGYDMVPMRGDYMVKRAELKGGSGFSALTFRGRPVIADDFCPTGNMYFLNERYLTWKGRTIVPEGFRDDLKYVDLGATAGQTTEGVMAAPSKYHGWFAQDLRVLPNQAGAVGRYYVFGQICTDQPRRFGKLTGVTTI